MKQKLMVTGVRFRIKALPKESLVRYWCDYHCVRHSTAERTKECRFDWSDPIGPRRGKNAPHKAGDPMWDPNPKNGHNADDGEDIW